MKLLNVKNKKGRKKKFHMTKLFKGKHKFINIFYVHAGIFIESTFPLTSSSLENHSTFSVSTQEQWM